MAGESRELNHLILKDDDGTYYAIPRDVLQQYRLAGVRENGGTEDDASGYYWGVDVWRLLQEQAERERAFKSLGLQTQPRQGVQAWGWY
jgi:hypothetical protein